MKDAVTDTHALIWFLTDSPRLGPQANKIFEACEEGKISILIPTICLVEIVYLQEKKRIPNNLLENFINELQNSKNMIISDLSYEVVKFLEQVPRIQVSDMPDRIIAATALSLNLPLISRDRKIQLSSIETVW